MRQELLGCFYSVSLTEMWYACICQDMHPTGRLRAREYQTPICCVLRCFLRLGVCSFGECSHCRPNDVMNEFRVTWLLSCCLVVA